MTVTQETSAPRHRVHSFACLDLSFSFSATDPDVAAVVNTLYSHCECDSEPHICFHVSRRACEGSDRYELFVDGALHFDTTNAPSLIDRLVWEINQRVIATSAASLMLHAACVEAERRALVIAGQSGIGKSTLVTALVGNGFCYLTDEVVAFDTTSALVRPYPKPIALRRDVWPLFAELPPLPSHAALRWMGSVRYLSPEDIGGGVGRPSAPVLVILPRRGVTSAPRLHEISRAETVMQLADGAFSFRAIGAPALRQLAKVLRTCRCYELHYEELADAVRLITHAFRDQGTGAEQS
jgi:hypothetical protein